MVQAGRGCRPLHCLFLHNVHMPWTSKARYTLATKLNSTRSTLLKVDKIDRVAFSRYTPATKSTVTSCRIHVVADLLPVSATVNCQQSRRFWIQLCRQCVPGFTNRKVTLLTDSVSIGAVCGVKNYITSVRHAVFRPWHRPRIVLPLVYCPVDGTLSEGSPEIRSSGVSSRYCCYGNNGVGSKPIWNFLRSQLKTE